jgi:hypothetical protein
MGNAKEVAMRERLSTFGQRSVGTFLVFTSLVMLFAKSEQSAETNVPELHGAGFFLLALGLSFVGWTIPHYRKHVLAWREVLARSWSALITIYVTTLVLTFGLMQSFFGSVIKRQADSASNMARNAVETQGRVVGFAQGGEQAPVIFQFKVGRRTFITSSSTHYATPSKSTSGSTRQRRVRHKLGDQVPVVYHRYDPQNAVLGSTQQLIEQAKSARLAQVVAPCFFTVFVFVMLLFQGVLPLPQR